jgi:hypothetical protein
VVELLVGSGADVNRYAKGGIGGVRVAETRPPLEIAETEKRTEIAELLKRHGARKRRSFLRWLSE